jgi:hypothetical protein
MAESVVLGVYPGASLELVGNPDDRVIGVILHLPQAPVPPEDPPPPPAPRLVQLKQVRNVRDLPSLQGSRIVMSLPAGLIVEVFEERPGPDNQIWLRLQHHIWLLARAGGVFFTKEVG